MARWQILMHHIHATLPDIKVHITEQQKKFNTELQSLGGMVADKSGQDNHFARAHVQLVDFSICRAQWFSLP